MLTHRIYSVLIATLGAIGTGPQAHAQGLSPIDPVRWDQGRLVVMNHSHFGRPTLAEIFDPQGKKTQDIPIPPNPKHRMAGGSVAWHEGVLHWTWKGATTTPEGQGFEEEMVGYSQGKWSTLGVFRHKTGVCSIFPMGKGRYLAITVNPGLFIKDGNSFPLAILKLDSRKEFYVDETLDLGLDRPFFQGKQRNYPSFILGLISPQVVYNEDHLILGTPQGLFWVFDLEKGRLLRKERLFHGITEERLAAGDIFPPLLGFQPRPDGRILISARSEDAALLGMKAFRPPQGPQRGAIPDREAAEFHVRRQGEWEADLSRNFPHIQWWVLDPYQGGITRMDAPLRVPTLIWSREEAQDFNWRFLPDGNLKIYSYKEKNPPPTEAQIREQGLPNAPLDPPQGQSSSPRGVVPPMGTRSN